MLKFFGSSASKCLYSTHLTSDRAWKEGEKGIHYSSVSERIFTCMVLNSSVNCLITASINIFNDLGDHCPFKQTRNYYMATLEPSAPTQIHRCPRASRGVSTPSPACQADRCSWGAGKRRTSQPRTRSAGVALSSNTAAQRHSSTHSDGVEKRNIFSVDNLF